jgi:hypothetical protein
MLKSVAAWAAVAAVSRQTTWRYGINLFQAFAYICPKNLLPECINTQPIDHYCFAAS